MIGEEVGGWQLGEILGEGTQGTVYAARHRELHRDAAIKLLLPRLARDQTRVERFFDEARAAGSIQHAGVVEIYDCGRDPSGRIYIAMERLTGETLHARLRRAPPALGEALVIVRQLAEALAAAHDAGIVHRDLKPENVFLAVTGTGEVRVKIVDFGIAKLNPALRSGGTLTGAGLFGTPPYMSPEQCAGSDTIDHRTDLYALGCLIYELATGTPPFGFDRVAELVEAHRHETPPRLLEGCPDAPIELDDLAARLLEKNPAARPASSHEIIEVIDRLGLATSIAAPAATRGMIAPTVIARPAGWRAAIWRKLLELQPWVAAGVACLIGACLLGVAIVAGVGDSYGSSNWGVTYIAIVPLVVSFQLRAMQRSDAALRELVKRGMIRGAADVAVTVRTSSERLGAGLVGFSIATAIPAIAVSVGEWHHRWRDLPIAGTWWTESALVGIVGAVCQGILIAAILVFAVHCIAWPLLLHQLTGSRARASLTIDRASTDPRRGFEVLEEPVVLALLAGALVQLSLYLSNVQHFAEVRGKSLMVVLAPSLELFGDRGMLDTGTGRYPSTTTLLASMLVVSFLIAGGFVLWRAVREADDEETSRHMWPLLRLGPIRLMVLLVAAAAFTAVYRLGPIAIAILVPWLAWSSIRRRTS